MSRPLSIPDTVQIDLAARIAAQPEKKRKWFWAVGALILIGVMGNFGDEDGWSWPTSTERQAYVARLLPLMLDSASASGDGADIAFAAADGDITYDQAAVGFSEIADTFADVVDQIGQLGDPPSGLSEATNFFTRSLTVLEAGYQLAAMGAQQRDVALITEGNQRLDEGDALLTRAHAALEGR